MALPTYVIQKHFATRLHYDLRLEFNGALKSWAVPRDPGEAMERKILAIQTEDHPLDYARFSGTIPKDRYGAGKVEIWDRGTFEVESQHDEKIVIIIRGQKLKGRFTLLLFRPPKQWLFFKTKE